MRHPLQEIREAAAENTTRLETALSESTRSVYILAWSFLILAFVIGITAARNAH